MTRDEAREILKRHNQWRRGAEIPMESPKDIGEAIDTLLNAEADYTEQMRQLNEEWKENLAIQRKMLIDKACEWFSNYLFQIGYPDDWERDSVNMISGSARFRKVMEL